MPKYKAISCHNASFHRRLGRYEADEADASEFAKFRGRLCSRSSTRNNANRQLHSSEPEMNPAAAVVQKIIIVEEKNAYISPTAHTGIAASGMINVPKFAALLCDSDAIL